MTWYHFTSEMISYHFTGLNCPVNNLVGPIELHAYILADAWRQSWREELLWRQELLCSFINAFLYFNLVA